MKNLLELMTYDELAEERKRFNTRECYRGPVVTLINEAMAKRLVLCEDDDVVLSHVDYVTDYGLALRVDSSNIWEEPTNAHMTIAELKKRFNAKSISRITIPERI